MEINVDVLKTQIKGASELYMHKKPYQNDGMKNRINNLKAILEACMSENYTTETGDFKGSKTLSISKGEKRVISFGLTKAKAILAAFEDIKTFVEANDKGEIQKIDLNKLSPEQQDLVNSFIQK